MSFRPQFPFSIPRAGPFAIGSFAEPASVRGFKFVDMLGGTAALGNRLGAWGAWASREASPF